jgi:predicted O-methyltransferase YrrM
MVTPTNHYVWSAFTVEKEGAELLYALVRYYKPKIIVEDGTGEGLSTCAMAMGMAHNGEVDGVIHTYEPMRSVFDQMQEAWANDSMIKAHRGQASLRYKGPVDMVFVDTGGGTKARDNEIRYWLTLEGQDPLIVVHDAKREYETLALGEGVFIPGWDGIWIGRGK